MYYFYNLATYFQLSFEICISNYNNSKSLFFLTAKTLKQNIIIFKALIDKYDSAYLRLKNFMPGKT